MGKEQVGEARSSLRNPKQAGERVNAGPQEAPFVSPSGTQGDKRGYTRSDK